MKKIITAMLLMIAMSATAQIDSLKIKTAVSLQVRDWVYLNSFLKNNPVFENVYDSMKIKLRITVAPSATTVIKVDSVYQGQVLQLAAWIKKGAYGYVVIPYSRINTALRANAYLIRQIDAMDAEYIARYNLSLQLEYDGLRAAVTIGPPEP